MGLEQMVTTFPWTRYSRKLLARIAHPRNSGLFCRDEADKRNMRLVVGCEGTKQEGNVVCLYWLVDVEDGQIVDAKFQVFGQSALVGAADVFCDLVVGKNYDQASRMTADLLDKELSSKGQEKAFPEETYPHMNLVLEAADKAAQLCGDIPLAATYVAPPAPEIADVLEGGIPGFDQMSEEEKLYCIEQVLDRDVRPYIAMDGGGVEVDALQGEKLVIIYQGNCVSCFSAVGATLSYIQQVIKAKVHPDLTVEPKM